MSDLEQKLRPFTRAERTTLQDDGAMVFSLSGEKLRDLAQYRNNPTLLYWENDWRRESPHLHRILNSSSRNIDVAIYPRPNAFFVEDSFERTRGVNKNQLRHDGRRLNQRLGLVDITEVLPSAAEMAEVFLKHNTITGEHLLDQDYANYGMVRTLDRYPIFGRRVPTLDVLAGPFHPLRGSNFMLSLRESRACLSNVGVARFVVAQDR